LEEDLDIPKDNTGLDSKIFFLASQPSSIGEDVILRCVIGGINSAKQSISICMGHFNVPLPVAKALQAATERGVKVSVLANSLYSCDLRGGQRDLFLSLRQLLALAPKIDLVCCVN
jgi:phosphatidylserine/phosphatidylglycerophosphate/cardiolipin synthase-like enzyme